MGIAETDVKTTHINVNAGFAINFIVSKRPKQYFLVNTCTFSSQTKNLGIIVYTISYH